MDDSAHSVIVATQSGVYFGTFFCMNGCWSRCTRITESGRSASAGIEPVGDAVEVVDEVALGGPGVGEQRLIEVGELDPVTGLVGPRCHVQIFAG